MVSLEDNKKQKNNIEVKRKRHKQTIKIKEV
jgi:hypothetical protein